MSLLALQDLFRRYRDRSTGVWKLGQDPSRTVYFDYGDTVFATSTHLQDRLTTILVERGRVTQAQMDYALGNLKPGISIGKNLIEMGFITQRDLLDMAKIQVERIIVGSMAQADLIPVFEPRELDAHVVRLPLNTAQLLLTGMLSIQDREWLLELLGPLNQVVVLQGRSLLDLALPADLAKLVPLLDGTHTLLELSRESQAEPMRVGAFALFLREMGWARLHEMPPLDRQALDLALEPAAPTPSAPLPAPPADTVPTLFETIQEAARPTTNLEHLSKALDDESLPLAPLPGSEPAPILAEEELRLPEPLLEEPAAAPPLQVVNGHAEIPTPSVELPPLPEAPVEPPVTLLAPLEEPFVEELPAPPEPEPPARAPFPLRWVLGVAVAGAALAAGFLWMRRKAPAPRVPPAAPAPARPAPPPPAPVAPGPGIAVPPTEASKAEPAKAEPAKAEPPRQETAKEAPGKAKAGAPKGSEPAGVGTSLAERLESLRRGDLGKAIAQGQQRVKDVPGDHWALRLEIACQGETIQRVADLFKDGKPDLFLLPMTLRDGRTCYQVMYGNFTSKDAAVKESRALPAAFAADHPRPYRYAEIPKQQ